MSRSVEAELPHEPGQAGEASVGDGESPVFVEGEDRADYEQLRAAVKKAVTPCDAIEELLVGDIVYLAWEARRLRRLKDHLLKSSAWRGLPEILEPLMREVG